MSPVVVFDTNILFSAIGWRGRQYECLEYARNGPRRFGPLPFLSATNCAAVTT
jgi:hypothetical protein